SSRAVVVDARPRPGGMWVDTYDYVRLHQPHPIFTAGKIKWQLDAPPSHLASKAEVLDHLKHCLDVARAKVDLDERFGWTYLGHTEGDGLVEVVLRAPDGSTQTLLSRRLVKAFGHQVQPNAPLSTTSDRVRSITPETLDLTAVRASGTPVWIVGGGKTAMDTAYRLITEVPDCEVHLLAGPGTMFSRRETLYPTGARRWWGGTPTNTMVREIADRFDGTNETEVRDWFAATYGVSPVPGAVDYFGANLSEEESRVISRGLRSAERAYFADAVDRGTSDADGVDVVDRVGVARPVPTGTWIVNCTGSLLRSDHPYEPYTSPTGNVLSIQMRSSTFGPFSSFAGYFMTHLMFRDLLTSAPLVELDIAGVHRQAPASAIYAGMTVALHNLSVALDVLPKKVLLDCGIDYNLWFPPHRQLAGVVTMLATHHRKRAHDRRTIDALGTRFGIRSGPLAQITV
uniref:potassium transporter n=1 Tax=Nocardioides stalactiti TaxID=2755356 RepID=UPI00160390A6